MSGVDGKTLSQLTFGVTTLIFRCSVDGCGELKKIEALGKVEELRTKP